MTRLTLFVDVLLPISVPNYYTYRVPFELNDFIKVGQRVVVQFGKSKLYTALVRKVHENPPIDYAAKYIEEIVDELPIIRDWQFEFWEWIANYYLCYNGEIMQAAIPSGLKLNSESKVILSQDIEWETFDFSKYNKTQRAIIDLLQVKSVLAIKEISSSLKIKNIQEPIKVLLENKIITSQEEIKNKYKPKKASFLRLHERFLLDESLFESLITELEKKAFKQLEILFAYLNYHKGFQNLRSINQDEQWVLKSVLINNKNDSSLKSLITKKVFLIEEFELSRLSASSNSFRNFELSDSQGKVLSDIKKSFQEKEVCLLHGITGSGKTEVYLKLIEEQFQLNKNVLYLIPEIALTTQLIQRLKNYFGEKVLVYHSRFSENERVEIWNQVLLNTSAPFVMVGARSSIFLPFSDLNLIIVDEEHDSSFKQQDPAPRYNARDLAIYLGRKLNAKVLLGSATPSLETIQNCIEKKFAKVEMFQRYGDAQLPDIFVANSRNDETRKFTSIGIALKEAIKETLDNKSQIILFQNRRGFAPYTQCEVCDWIPTCENCDVNLIYHKNKQQFNCHYCGYACAPFHLCKACGSNDLRFKGYGTEKIEEEIEILFPDAKVQRMDLDSTRNKHAYRQIIEEFSNGEIDILVGTQMVTKGLDFDNVTLVGVLNADSLFNFPDFRAFERSFQLLSQVSGRAGRKTRKGKVLIQTERPDHPVLNWVTNSNFNDYYKNLLETRKQFEYPPFFRIIEFYFKSKDQNEVFESAKWFTNELQKLKIGIVLGPEFPLVARVKNEYILKTIIKIDKQRVSSGFRERILNLYNTFRATKLFHSIRLQTNVDPQ